MTLKYIKENNFLIYSVALLSIYSIKMVSISIAAFVIGALIAFDKQDVTKREVYKNMKVVLLFSLPFFLHLISLLWTENLNVGFKALEKNLSFLIFPIAIFFLKPFKSKQQIEVLKKVYVVTTFILTLLTILYITYKLAEILNQKNEYLATMSLRQNINSVPIIGEHPIYFSLLIALALIFLFYNGFRNKFINIAFYIIFSLGILLASSRGIILALIAVSLVIVFQSNKTFLYRMFVLASILVGVVIIGLFPPVKARINEMVNTRNIYPKGIHFNSFNTRMAIYNCSFQILKRAPIVGYSPGDIQKELDECYEKFDTSAFDKQKFNTHNQYFDYLISFGVFGVIFIVFVLPYYIKVSISNQTGKVYLSVLVLFFIAFITENILVRNTGIVLFSFFNSLLAYVTLFKREFEK